MSFNDELLDCFFNFKEPTAPFAAQPKCLKTVPITAPFRLQTIARETSGTEYSVEFIRNMQRAMSRVSYLIKGDVSKLHSFPISQNFSKLVLNVPRNNLTAVTAPTVQTDTTTTSTLKTEVTFAEHEHRSDLAIFQSREEIIQNVNDSPIVIITGQTGCGKVSEIV